MSKGKILGDQQYKVGDVIATGAFSTVYHCTDLVYGNEYAVKVLNKKMIEEKGMCKALCREINAMELTPQSPYITNLIDKLESSRNYYIIMDLAEGGTVLDAVRKLPKGTAKRMNVIRTYFRHLLNGLQVLHSNNVVHRDIKPENLLLSKASTHLKISDFGFACYAPPNRVLHRACGTLKYCAPELLVENPAYDGRKVDIWAAGVTLYVMLFETHPFQGRRGGSADGVIESIRNGTYMIPFRVPQAVTHLLSVMLQKDPAKRWSLEELQRHMWVLGVDTIMMNIPRTATTSACMSTCMNSSLASSDFTYSAAQSPGMSAMTVRSGQQQQQQQQQDTQQQQQQQLTSRPLTPEATAEDFYARENYIVHSRFAKELMESPDDYNQVLCRDQRQINEDNLSSSSSSSFSSSLSASTTSRSHTDEDNHLNRVDRRRAYAEGTRGRRRNTLAKSKSSYSHGRDSDDENAGTHPLYQPRRCRSCPVLPQHLMIDDSEYTLTYDEFMDSQDLGNIDFSASVREGEMSEFTSQDAVELTASASASASVHYTSDTQGSVSYVSSIADGAAQHAFPGKNSMSYASAKHGRPPSLFSALESLNDGSSRDMYNGMLTSPVSSVSSVSSGILMTSPAQRSGRAMYGSVSSSTSSQQHRRGRLRSPSEDQESPPIKSLGQLFIDIKILLNFLVVCVAVAIVAILRVVFDIDITALPIPQFIRDWFDILLTPPTELGPKAGHASHRGSKSMKRPVSADDRRSSRSSNSQSKLQMKEAVPPPQSEGMVRWMMGKARNTIHETSSTLRKRIVRTAEPVTTTATTTAVKATHDSQQSSALKSESKYRPPSPTAAHGPAGRPPHTTNSAAEPLARANNGPARSPNAASVAPAHSSSAKETITATQTSTATTSTSASQLTPHSSKDGLSSRGDAGDQSTTTINTANTGCGAAPQSILSNGHDSSANHTPPERRQEGDNDVNGSQQRSSTENEANAELQGESAAHHWRLTPMIKYNSDDDEDLFPMTTATRLPSNVSGRARDAPGKGRRIGRPASMVEMHSLTQSFASLPPAMMEQSPPCSGPLADESNSRLLSTNRCAAADDSAAGNERDETHASPGRTAEKTSSPRKRTPQ